ncbi:golgin subfamily A member 4 isoform X2 [Hydra vulgaris]|uniref:Golgin subfamily A member 4 isoform X2 n=1 Tax=Hydra vulgaris TaxID=6087 RepID=A0ABM4DH67_HYDVU
MSGLKKLLSGKRKSAQKNQKQEEPTELQKTSLGNLSFGSKSGSSIDLIGLSENKNGYIVKNKDLSKVSKAVWQGDLLKLKEIANNKKKVNWNETDKENRTVLHLACAQGFAEIVEFIISNGANVNMSDSEGKTPLMKACEQSNTKIVECLLKNGAETNVFDMNHVSAMHIAAAQGNIEIGMMLADHNAKLDVKDKNQVTPLHLCCALGNKDFVDFLLTEYVAVNCIDSQRRTPLMAACIDGHEDIVELLIENNADVLLVDKDGSTAYQLAENYKNSGICAILKSHTAKVNRQTPTSRESPLSKDALFSPVAKSLNEMFSPSGSSGSRGSAISFTAAVIPTKPIFGQPADNFEVTEKSEESFSEKLGDNSWADSDSEKLSKQHKIPKGFNFSSLIKKKEFEKDSHIVLSTDIEKKKLDVVNNTTSTIDTLKTNVEQLVIERKNESLLKANNNFLPKEVNKSEEESLNTKNKKTSKPIAIIPPPPLDIEFNGNSWSQSDASDFSDLPISDFNKSSHDLINEVGTSDQVPKNDKNNNDIEFSMGQADSKWDSEESEVDSSLYKNKNKDENIKENNKINQHLEEVDRKATVAQKTKSSSISEDMEDSSWDSENSEFVEQQVQKNTTDILEDVHNMRENEKLTKEISPETNDYHPDNDLEVLLSPTKPKIAPRILRPKEDSQTVKENNTESKSKDDRKKNLIALGILTSTEEEESESEWEIEQRKRKELTKINQTSNHVLKKNDEVAILPTPNSFVATKMLLPLGSADQGKVKNNSGTENLELIPGDQVKKETAHIVFDSSSESTVLYDDGDTSDGGQKIDNHTNKQPNLLYESQADKNIEDKIVVSIQNSESTHSLSRSDGEVVDEADQEIKESSESFDDFSLSEENSNSKFSEEISTSVKEPTCPLPMFDDNAVSLNLMESKISSHSNIVQNVDNGFVPQGKLCQPVLNNVECKSVKFAKICQNLESTEIEIKDEVEIHKKNNKYRKEENAVEEKISENFSERIIEISQLAAVSIGKIHDTNEIQQKDVDDDKRILLIAEKEKLIEKEMERVQLLQKELTMKTESFYLREKEFETQKEMLVKEEQVLKAQLFEKENRLVETKLLLDSEVQAKELLKQQLVELEVSLKKEILFKEESIQAMIKTEQASQGLIEKLQKEMQNLVDLRNEMELKLLAIIENEKKIKIEMENKRAKDIESLINKKEEELQERINQIQTDYQRNFNEKLEEKNTYSNIETMKTHIETLEYSLETLKEKEKTLKESLVQEEEVLRQSLHARIESEEVNLKKQLFANMKVLEEELYAEHEKKLKSLSIEATEQKNKHESQLNEKIAEIELKFVEKEKSLEFKEIQRKENFDLEAEKRETELAKSLKIMELNKKQELAVMESSAKEAWEKRLQALEEEYKKKEESLHKKVVLGREQDEDKRETTRGKVNEVTVDLPDMHTNEINHNEFAGRSKELEDCLATSKIHRDLARKKVLAMSSIEINRHVETDDFLVIDMDMSSKSAIIQSLKHHGEGNTLDHLKSTSTPKKDEYKDEAQNRSLQKELDLTRNKLNLLMEKAIVQDHLSKEMECDITEMHRTIELLTHGNSDKEKSLLDLDLQLRSVKYKLDQEAEARMVAEKICQQLKDQINKSNQKATKEVEERLSLEQVSQQTLSDLKILQNRILKLESEKEELKVLLDAEKKARSFQEELYKDQLHQHELILTEARKSSLDHAQAISKIHMLDETKKQVESSADFLKVELAKTNVELSSANSKYEELKHRLETELSSLQKSCDSKSDKIVLVEKELIQTQLHLENEKSNFKIEMAKLQMLLEKEENQSHRLSEEVHSLQNRLKQSDIELDKVSADKLTIEKQAIIEREKGHYEKLSLEKDLAFTKDQLKSALKRLESSELSANSLTDQLQSIELALSGKREEFMQNSNEVQTLREAVLLLENKIKNNQELNSKLTTKLELEEEKNKSTLNELYYVKKELDVTKEQLVEKEHSTNVKQDSMNSNMILLQNDFLKEKSELLLINQQNMLRLEAFESKLQESDLKIKEKNSKYQKLLSERESIKLNLLNTESRIQALNKERDEYINKNKELEKTINQLREEKYEIEHQRCMLDQKLKEVSHTLDKTLLITDETTLKLSKQSSDVDKITNSNVELQNNINKLKNESISIEARLREEKAKAEVLLQDLRDANEARDRLEVLLSNAKGNNAALEEKLHSESLYRSMREKEAEEHKGLWESEIKSRSKLGVKILGMEKEINDLKAQIDEERRKTRRAIDLKKATDGKVEVYEQRSEQHHREILILRNKIKQYQKKLKGTECGESQLQTIYADFDKERQSFLLDKVNLKRQLDQVSEHLRQEQEMRSRLEKINYEQTIDIANLRSAEKVYFNERESLEKSLRENMVEVENLKKYYEHHYVSREEIEEYKRDMETKARLDVNKKLQEVNLHLEEQSLAREAFEKIRIEREVKARKDMEETISQLKMEISSLKSNLFDGLAKRDTSEIQAQRFKTLFHEERNLNDKIHEKLEKTNDLLALQRNCTNVFFEDSISKISKKLLEDSPNKYKYSPALHGQFSSYPKPTLWSTIKESSPNGNSAERDYADLFERRNLLS